jgi:hypothetical protein
MTTNTIIAHQDTLSVLWMIGWLFTIGYLDLKFWKGFLAIILWPVYMGRKFRKPTTV